MPVSICTTRPPNRDVMRPDRRRVADDDGARAQPLEDRVEGRRELVSGSCARPRYQSGPVSRDEKSDAICRGVARQPLLSLATASLIASQPSAATRR